MKHKNRIYKPSTTINLSTEHFAISPMQNHQLEFSMHDLQLGLSGMSVDPRNDWQGEPQVFPPPPPPFIINLFTMPQLSEAHVDTTWCEDFSSLPSNAGPVYQMSQPHQGQYRAPRWGLTHHQRSKGSHKAGAPYLNKSKRESSGSIARDRSTGIHPGMARRMDVTDNTGAGKVQRTPP